MWTEKIFIFVKWERNIVYIGETRVLNHLKKCILYIFPLESKIDFVYTVFTVAIVSGTRGCVPVVFCVTVMLTFQRLFPRDNGVDVGAS